MTITIDAASTPVDEHGERVVAPGRTVAAARRGRTTVSRRAVESIVGRVAIETPGVAAAELGGIRGWLSTRPPERADAEVAGSGDGLHIVLSLAIDYPRPVSEVVGEVRRRVVAHLDERFDLRVDQLDVRVTELRPRRAPVSIERRVR